MRTVGGGATGVIVGRSDDIAAIRHSLAHGRAVVVTGEAGIGKTATVAAAAGTRTLTITGLAAVSWRPLVPVRHAIGPLPSDDVTTVSRLLIARVGNRALIVEDAQFADTATLEVVCAAARSVPVVAVIRTGEPATRRALDRLAALEPDTVHLGPLGREAIIEVCRSRGADETAAVAIAAASGGHPLWARLELGDAPATLPHAIAARLARADLAARTVVAALGLLRRPAPVELLGPGVDAAVDGGFVTVVDGTAAPVHPLVADVAAARLTTSDREALHRALGHRLADDAEAARHLHAGGDHRAAGERARAAAATAAPADRAALHALAATATGDAYDALAAARAALDAGTSDAHRWAATASTDPTTAAAGHALAATAARRSGDLDTARGHVVAGLRAVVGTGETWRRLRIEALLVDPAATPADAEEIADACAGTAEEPAAGLARVLTALRTGDVRWERWLADLITTADAAGDQGTALDARFVAVRALAAAGDYVTAARRARDAARATTGTWAERFTVEAAWLAAAALGPAEADEPAGDERTPVAVTALRLSDLARHDDARRLLAGAEGPRELAAAAVVGWWTHDDTAAGAARTALDNAGRDPVVVALAGPIAVRSGIAVEPAPPALQVEATAAAAEDRELAISGYEEAAERWGTGRNRVRCLWSALDSTLSVDPRGAAARLESAIAATDDSGVRAADSRLTTSAASIGRRWHRGERAEGLTSRETEVIRLVGEGLSTPMIARRLGVTSSTVESHVRSAVAKLGVENRRAAAARLA